MPALPLQAPVHGASAGIHLLPISVSGLQDVPCY